MTTDGTLDGASLARAVTLQMAIIKLGTLITGIRGTVGGATFSQNTSSPYVKAWKQPIRPRTPKQIAAQNILGAWPEQWRALTQVQRDAWDTWAALPAQEKTNSLGEGYFINGFQWYVAINTHALQLNFTPLVAPPSTAKPAAPTVNTFTVSKTGPVATLTYPSGEFGGANSIVVYVATWPSQSAITPPKNFRFIAAALFPGDTSFSFPTQYVAALGNPIPGTKAFAHVYIQSQQRYRSAPTLIAANIGA